MGRKVFVSYKYSDTQVANLNKKDWKLNFGQFQYISRATRARDYVDEFQKIIGYDNINLGEKDGESLAEFSDDHIQTKLKDKIFHSSMTVVIISKGMKDFSIVEKDQWIPWEISYSLREVSREDRISRMNAILGIVIPDENGSYNWYYSFNSECNCTTHNTGQLFGILRHNMFNMKRPIESYCNGLIIHEGGFSYIKTVKWDDFVSNPNFFLDKAIEIRSNKAQYNISINL